jgi:hypothetical protein
VAPRKVDRSTPPDTLLICTARLLASSLLSAKTHATYPDSVSVTLVAWFATVVSPLIWAATVCVKNEHGSGNWAVDDVEVALADTDPPAVGTTEPHPAMTPTMGSRKSR